MKSPSAENLIVDDETDIKTKNETSLITANEKSFRKIMRHIQQILLRKISKCYAVTVKHFQTFFKPPDAFI